MKLQKFTLEPALLFLFFGWYLSLMIITNQILKQTCLYTYKHAAEICTQLDDKEASNSVEQEIQPYVANILMTINFLSYLISTVLSLFLGPWSDKYGRKKVINCIFIGFTVSMAWITLVSYSSEYIAVNSPWNYLFAQFPFMIFGGWPTLITLILCYITDITDEVNRSTRFTIFEIIIFIGVLIAIASSSFILEATGATTVFFISFLCISIGTTIVIFFVDETVAVNHDIRIVDQFKDLFTPTRVKELFKTCVRRRPGKQRQILWLLAIILVLTNFANHGSSTVFYLFVRQTFGWNLQDLTLYEAASMIVTLFGSIVGLVVFKKILNFSDISLSILSIVSLLIDALIKSGANQSWQLYLASTIALFKIISLPMLRSIMSTLVTQSEVSRIYSITTSIESIAGLGAAPLYAATYSATLTTFPATFYLITASVFTVALIMALFIARWLKSSQINTKTIVTSL